MVGSIDDLSREYDTFTNYVGVDDDKMASGKFEKHLALNRLKAYESIQEHSNGRSFYLSAIKSHPLSSRRLAPNFRSAPFFPKNPNENFPLSL